jgi:hypothetical protein
MSVPAPNESPLVCDLTDIEPAQRAKHTALASYLFGEAAHGRQELADGYAYRFAAELYDQVAAFVANERRCCPFLRFELELAADGGPLTLRLSGREGVKQLLHGGVQQLLQTDAGGTAVSPSHEERRA